MSAAKKDDACLQPLATMPIGKTARLLHIRTCLDCGGRICKKNVSGRCKFCSIRHIWTERMTSEQRTALVSDVYHRKNEEQRREWSLQGIAALTTEQRKEAAKKGNDSMSSEERSERSRRANAALTPEQRSERAKRRAAAETPERRRERALKGVATQTPEKRSEPVRLARSAMTAEEKSEAARRGWETRRSLNEKAVDPESPKQSTDR